MKKTIWERIIAAVLAAAMIFTSSAMDFSVFAADADVSGIGITNTVYTNEPSADIKYYVRFTQRVKNSAYPSDPVFVDGKLINPETNLPYEEGTEPAEYLERPFYLEQEFEFTKDGKKAFLEPVDPASEETMAKGSELLLGKDQSVDFTSSQSFADFIAANNLISMEIIYDESNLFDAEKEAAHHQSGDFMLFGSDGSQASRTKTYNLSLVMDNTTDEHGDPVQVVHRPYQLDVTGCTPAEFKSGEIVEFTVKQEWRDNGQGRPEYDQISFTIGRAAAGSEEYESYDVSLHTFPDTSENPNPDVKSSNEIHYTYKVPAFDENGDAYSYKVTGENLPDPETAGYEGRYEINIKDDTTVENVGLTEFECNIVWADIAHEDDRKTVDEDTIKDHFKLYHAVSGGDPEEITLDENHPITVTTTGNRSEVSIGGLVEIDDNGTAITYYLLPDEYSYPAMEFAENNDNSYNDISQDSYAISADNIGVNTNVVDRVYEGGTFNMLLTGTTEFTGELDWTDRANSSARSTAVNSGNAGDFILYRYVDDEEHLGSNYRELISQVGTWKINQGDKYLYQYETKDGEGNTVTATSIDKYDNTGAAYFYFAKERLSLGDYEIQYDNPVENFMVNGAAVFPNGTTVRNILTGSIVFTIDAKWIAAALQGGTGSVSYRLEKWDPTAGEGGEWVTATYADGEGHTQDAELTIDGFTAEVMDKTDAFPAVDRFDRTTGDQYRYRIVQTEADRTDKNSSSAPYTTEVVMQVNDSGEAPDHSLVTVTEGNRTRVKLEGENSDGEYIMFVGGHRFAVKVYKRKDANGNDLGNVFDYEYRLADQINIILDKDWGDIKFTQSTFSADSAILRNIWNASIPLRVQKFNYSTGNYENFDLTPYNTDDVTIDPTNGTVSLVRGDVYSSDRFSAIFEGVPKYDDAGHENRFRIYEQSHFTGAKPYYNISDVLDENNNVIAQKLTVTNKFGGGGDSVKVAKVWMDDGEEEYKSNILIEASSRLMPLPENTSTYNPGSGESDPDEPQPPQNGKVYNVTYNDINGFADPAALNAKIQEIQNALNPSGQGGQSGSGSETTYDAFDLTQWAETHHYNDERFDDLIGGKNAAGYLNEYYLNP